MQFKSLSAINNNLLFWKTLKLVMYNMYVMHYKNFKLKISLTLQYVCAINYMFQCLNSILLKIQEERENLKNVITKKYKRFST